MAFDKNKIEELYPGAGDLMIEPMLIHKGTEAQLKAADASGQWFGQLKKDGALYMFVKGAGGECYLFGRTVSKKTGLLTEKIANIPHISKFLSVVPNGTVLLGEIYYPGKTSKDVTSIMGCLADKAIQRQNGSYGLIHYYLYDVLYYNNVSLLDVENYTRYQLLEIIYKDHLFKNETCDYIELAPAWTDNLYNRVGQALSAGEEGMVFKLKSGMYMPGKRPQTMLKAKQVDFLDVVIMNTEEPTEVYSGKELEKWQYWQECHLTKEEDNNDLSHTYSTWTNVPIEESEFVRKQYIAGINKKVYRPVTKHHYNGWKNAIGVGVYNNGELVQIGTISSGLNDEMRAGLAERPEDYLGKVCKVQCMSIDKKEHTLRHGFFVSLRDDKDPEQCTFDTIFT